MPARIALHSIPSKKLQNLTVFLSEAVEAQKSIESLLAQSDGNDHSGMEGSAAVERGNHEHIGDDQDDDEFFDVTSLAVKPNKNANASLESSRGPDQAAQGLSGRAVRYPKLKCLQPENQVFLAYYGLQTNRPAFKPTPPTPSPEHNVSHRALIFRLNVYTSPATHPPTRLYEFLCLGTNTLSEVRDAIYCRSDVVYFADEKPPVDETERIAGIGKQAMFWLEDAVYVDSRFSDVNGPDLTNNREFTSKVRKWAGRNVEIGSTDVQLQDLTSLCLDKPYTFLHQIGCEHVITISEIRLASSDDPPSPASYPHQAFRIRFPAISEQLCDFCERRSAAWMTHRDIQTPSGSHKWCKECFDLFHFDEHGERVYGKEMPRAQGEEESQDNVQWMAVPYKMTKTDLKP